MASKNQIWILAAVAVFAYLFLMAPKAPVTTPGAVTGGTGTTPGVPPIVQQTLTSTTVTLAPSDFYGSGSVLDIEGVLMRGGTIVYDNDALATDTGKAVNPGETLSFAMWNDGQTSNLSGTGITLSGTEYYGIKGSYTVPYTPSDTLAKKVYKSANLDSVWATNSNGTVNAAASQWTLTANATDAVEFTLKAGSLACFGDPYAADEAKGILVVLDYNTSLYNSVSIEGTGVKLAAVPTNYLGIGDGAYELPVSALCNLEKKTYNLKVSVGALAPVDATADVNAYIVDPALYYQDKAGSVPTGFRYSTVDEVDKGDLGVSEGSRTLAFVN